MRVVNESTEPRVILRLDSQLGLLEIEQLAAILLRERQVKAFEVGLDMVLKHDLRQIIQIVTGKGGLVLCRVNIYDIPETVANAANALVAMGVWAFSISADMPARLISVTLKLLNGRKKDCLVLASFIRPGGKNLGLTSQIDGVIGSGLEVPHLRCQTKGLLVVSANLKDRGNLSPAQLIRQGADYVSINRFDFSLDISILLEELGQLNREIVDILEHRPDWNALPSVFIE